MGKLTPDTSVVTIYRRTLAPADALLVDAGENSDPALDTKKINVEEGEWVTLDASGKAVKLGASPGAAGGLAFPVWVSDRRDAAAAEGITVILGMHLATTSVFHEPSGPYTIGQALTAKLIGGLSQLAPAASGEVVVAIAEGPAKGATAAFPNGFLTYNNVNAGHRLP